MKAFIYTGEMSRDEVGLVSVRESGERRAMELDARLDLANHSPTGFQWGYSGSGPAQLALAILSHHFNATGTGDDAMALERYQTFKSQVLAAIYLRRWELTTDQIVDWLRTYEEARA